jgi:D-serine dehydratase
MRVARAVHDACDVLQLCGVEGYEGNIHGVSDEDTIVQVNAYLNEVVHIAEAIAQAGYFAEGQSILSAGGTAYYDLAIHRLKASLLAKKFTVITRSGCYLLHDSGYYDNHYQHLLSRDTIAAAIPSPMTHAVEIWSYVQSLPESGLAILNFGKRDASYDVTMPIPLYGVCDEEMMPLSKDYKILKMDDQHAFLSVPSLCPLRVGDKVGCGISHPCTTFDKWQWLPVVDDEYTVIDGVLTYF